MTVIPEHFTLQVIMRRVEIWKLVKLLNSLNEAIAYAVKRCEIGEGHMPVPSSGLETLVNPVVALARGHAKRMELQSTLDRVAGRTGHFSRVLSQAITFQELRPQLVVLREAIESDLEKRHFVFIPSDKAKVLMEMSGCWRSVWNKLPDCKTDSEEAVYSYCLERHTASVFHSMRVSEHGLRTVARKVGVKLTDKGKPQPIEFATWDKVLGGIRSKITSAHSLPQGPRKSRKLQFYSDAADSCTYLRDIWRNEVSHTRKSYTEAEALGVLNRVRDFMQLLSGAPK